MSADTDFSWDAMSEEDVKPAETATIPRTSRTGTTGTRRGGGRPPTKKLESLKSSLSKQMFTAGAMIGLGMPVTGYYIADQSDPFCDAIVTLAAKKADWIDALEHVADIGPGIIVGRTVLGIGCAMGVDRYTRTEGQSGINPDKRAAMLLGVSAAYHSIYEDDDGNASSNGFVPPPHGTFVPVS